MRKYFTLLQRDDDKSPWTIEFGDYDKACVTDELLDYNDHGIKKVNMKIITTSAHQFDIDAAVAALNNNQERISNPLPMNPQSRVFPERNPDVVTIRSGAFRNPERDP